MTKTEARKNLKKKIIRDRTFYRLQSILGYQWAIFYFLLGGRQAGKSYATTDFCLRQWRKYKRPFYWLRLTEMSTKKLLQNNAEKLVDPDLRRKYNLDLVTNGANVYEVTKNELWNYEIEMSLSYSYDEFLAKIIGLEPEEIEANKEEIDKAIDDYRKEFYEHN